LVKFNLNKIDVLITDSSMITKQKRNEELGIDVVVAGKG
jgi:hypothetical protein